MRPDDVAISKAMMNSKQPLWVMWANPAIGIIGVLIGGCVLCGREKEIPEA